MIHLEPHEEVILELRRHWFVMALEGVAIFAAALAPLVIAGVYLQLGSVEAEPGLFSLCIFFYSLWLLVLWNVFFIELTNYYLDVWILTDRRLIDAEQKTLFHRDVAMVNLENIEDITVEVNGLIQTMMHMGDIYVQTASNQSEFALLRAENPDIAKQIIFTTINRRKELQRTPFVTHQEEKPSEGEDLRV